MIISFVLVRPYGHENQGELDGKDGADYTFEGMRSLLPKHLSFRSPSDAKIHSTEHLQWVNGESFSIYWFFRRFSLKLIVRSDQAVIFLSRFWCAVEWTWPAWNIRLLTLQWLLKPRESVRMARFVCLYLYSKYKIQNLATICSCLNEERSWLSEIVDR